MLTHPAKEKSRFIIVCLNTCLTATYITHNKLVYFWCTLFSFNSEVLYNFAGVKTNHRTSMLNFIKFLLSLFVLATSAQKGYCDSLDTIISLHFEEDHDKATGIPHAPIRVPVIYIQQQNNIISWEEDVMATTIVITDDNGDEVFSEEVEGRTSVTIPECIKGEYDLVLYIHNKEYIGRIEL